MKSTYSKNMDYLMNVNKRLSDEVYNPIEGNKLMQFTRELLCIANRVVTHGDALCVFYDHEVTSTAAKDYLINDLYELEILITEVRNAIGTIGESDE